MSILRLPNILLKAFIVLLPWPLKRFLLINIFGYKLHPSARIGVAWIYPKLLRMAAGSRISSLTVAVNLDLLDLAEISTIDRGNWITGFPTSSDLPYFSHQPTRHAELLLGAHSAITKNHHFDATNSIVIGDFTTIAGYHSQFLSHSIDFQQSRQHSEPIRIGSYCFVGSSCVILGGSVLPDHCVLGALSLLNKPLCVPWVLYAGQPARRIKDIDQDAAYFCRNVGSVE
jgi:acetyltransferase-like isoleucine patch superfamily enzyme